MGDTTRVSWGPFEVLLPSEWVSGAVPSGLWFAPASLLAAARAELPVDAILLQEVGHGDMAELVHALMQRRVPRGEPEVKAAQMAGLPAQACSWTDGVSLVWSWFMQIRGHVFEIQVGAPAIRTAGSPDYGAAAIAIANSIVVRV